MSKNSQAANMMTFAAVALVIGLAVILLAPDDDRTPRGFPVDAVGWFMVGNALLLFLVALRERRR